MHLLGRHFPLLLVATVACAICLVGTTAATADGGRGEEAEAAAILAELNKNMDRLSHKLDMLTVSAVCCEYCSLFTGAVD